MFLHGFQWRATFVCLVRVVNGHGKFRDLLPVFLREMTRLYLLHLRECKTRSWTRNQLIILDYYNEQCRITVPLTRPNLRNMTSLRSSRRRVCTKIESSVNVPSICKLLRTTSCFLMGTCEVRVPAKPKPLNRLKWTCAQLKTSATSLDVKRLVRIVELGWLPVCVKFMHLPFCFNNLTLPFFL